MMLDESRRSIDNQLSELDELRSRGASAMGFAGVVAGIALAHSGGSDVLKAAIGVSAILSAAFAGYVLLPVTLLVNMSASGIGTTFRSAATPSDAMETMALYMEGNYRSNATALKNRHDALFGSLFALGLEVVFVGLLLL
jgi:hypothetical protein